MPKKQRVKKVSMQGGAGVMDWLKKANDYLRKSKVISGVAGALGNAGVPYASQVAGVAGKLGYGRRKKRSGQRGRGYADQAVAMKF